MADIRTRLCHSSRCQYKEAFHCATRHLPPPTDMTSCAQPPSWEGNASKKGSPRRRIAPLPAPGLTRRRPRPCSLHAHIRTYRATLRLPAVEKKFIVAWSRAPSLLGDSTCPISAGQTLFHLCNHRHKVPATQCHVCAMNGGGSLL